MALTTGIVTNTRALGTAATNIIVNVSNANLSNPLTVHLRINASVNSNSFYTAYFALYALPPASYNVKQFFIAGNVAYDVQVSFDGDFGVVSIYGIDESGNLVNDQGFTMQDLSFIPQFFPFTQ